MRVPQPTISRYAVAVAVVAVVTLLKHFILTPLIGHQQWFLLYVAAICVSSWYGGFGPGIVTAMLSALAADVFFAPPPSVEPGAALSVVFQLLLFLLEGLLVVGLTGHLREARSAAQRNERTKEEALALLDTFQVYAPVGLAFLDNDLRFLRINYAMAEIDGLTPAAHIGRTLQEVQPRIDPELLAGIQQVVTTGQPLLDHPLTLSRATLLGAKQQHFITSYYRVRGADGEPIGVGAVMVDMTAHTEAEAALRESESRFRSLADSAPVMIWIADKDAGALYFNRFWLDFTGRALDEELGSGWLASVHPDDREAFGERHQEAFAARREYETELRLRRHDGEYRWIYARGVPRYAADGSYGGYIGSALDITERKQEEIAGEFILQSGEILASSLDYETTLRNVAQLAVPTVADWCAVDLLTPAGSVERVTVAHIDPAKVRWAYELQERFPINMDAPTGLPRVLRTGETEFYPDVTEAMIAAAVSDAESYQLLTAIGFTSVIIAPMRARGRTIGAITLVTTESRRHYSTTDVRLAELLAVRAALAVDNACLYREARAERERFRVTLTSIGDAVIATDRQGRVTFINEVAQTLTGWDEAAALGQPLGAVFRIINEQSRQPVENPVEKVLREGRIVGLANHTVLVSKAGSETPIDDSGAPIPIDDSSAGGGVVLVFRDVSARKRREQRQEFLAEASKVLISSLEYESTLQHVTELAVPKLADWCAVYLSQQDGDIRQVALTHNDPAGLKVRQELMRRYPLPQSKDYGYPKVIRTGQAELLEAVGEDILQAAATNAEHLELLRQSRYESSICVPLKHREQTFGAITFNTKQGGRKLNREDLVLAEELGRIASLAIENARLYRSAQSASASDEHSDRA